MHYDLIIVGGGIVGLATALNILENNSNKKVLILEKEDQIAKHQTGNNSGVIHSGIYYKPGSLKAQNCINGYHLLLDFCRQHDVQHELCGKVIVATSQEEVPALMNIYKRGVENGLEGLKIIDEAEIKEKEPHINGIKGIWVPQAGIIDYKDVAKKYAELIEKHGGIILCNHEVIDVRTDTKIAKVVTEDTIFTTDLVVTCAGLYADKVAQMSDKKAEDFRIIPFRGEYYEIKKEKQYLINNLVYPVPNPSFPFLGVHFTRMVKGGIEAGPNAVLAYAKEGYTKKDFHLVELFESLTWGGFQKVAMQYWQVGFGEFYRSYSKKAFTKALQKLLPEITEDDLIPGGAGVRAQACDKSGGLIDDFKILEEEKVINVCNAPSPAATSSLSIGKTIAEMIQKRF